MRLTPAGFLRPCQTRPVEAETDRLIGETCPGIRLTQESREGDDHPLWGPLVAVRTFLNLVPDRLLEEKVDVEEVRNALFYARSVWQIQSIEIE